MARAGQKAGSLSPKPFAVISVHANLIYQLIITDDAGFSLIRGREAQNAIFSSRSGTSRLIKRSRFQYPLAFILSSLILLLSASAFPFETRCRMAFRIIGFSYRFRGVFIIGTSVGAGSHLSQSLHVFPLLHGCSRYPLPALSAPL